MGVVKQTLSDGDKATYPKPGDKVIIDYSGFIYDESKPDKKGHKFDSSIGRSDFVTEIGVGKVIKGWDEGVPQMSLGEKAELTISSDYAYGERGFPNQIPPRSILIFEVHLKGINDKKA